MKNRGKRGFEWENAIEPKWGTFQQATLDGSGGLDSKYDYNTWMCKYQVQIRIGLFHIG